MDERSAGSGAVPSLFELEGNTPNFERPVACDTRLGSRIRRDELETRATTGGQA